MTVDQPSTQPTRGSGVLAAQRRFTSGANLFFYRLTGGAVGGRMGGRPILLLTTIGRKSGKERVWRRLFARPCAISFPKRWKPCSSTMGFRSARITAIGSKHL